MTRQTFSSGETPSHTKLQNVSDQTFVTVTTAQLVGMASPPTGIHAYNTDLDLDYYYNGSDWIMTGGNRLVGCSVVRTNLQNVATNSNDTYDLDTILYDTDDFCGQGIITTSTDFTGSEFTTITIPTGLDGMYSASYFVYLASTNGSTPGQIEVYWGGGGYWQASVGNQANRAHLNATFAASASDTITLKVLHQAGTTIGATCRFILTRIGPVLP